MQESAEAVRRLTAAMQNLDLRMQHAAGDLDYESYLHEKRTLASALRALKERQAADEKK